METVIELRGVHFRYDPDAWVLEGIDLSIGSAEYVVVGGANGSGKSTLGYLLNGLIPHFVEGELSGNVIVAGHDTRDLAVADLAAQVGLVLQNPEAQLFNATVAEDIAFGLESFGGEAALIDKKVIEVAASLHIEHLLERAPDGLSGGEKRLAAIASVLALEPSVVVLDEPFAELDWAGVALVRGRLRNLHRAGKTIIVIEQRLQSAIEEATRCIILENGRVLFDGTAVKGKEILAAKQLIVSYPQRLPRMVPNDPPILSAHNLCRQIDGEPILKEVSLEIRRGESVALIGRNGAGKTSLIKHFNALLKPCSGSVVLFGENTRAKRTSELAAHVGLSFQNPHDQFFKLRVDQELRVGASMQGRVDDEWIDRVLHIFKLSGLLDRSPFRLSEGEKKRVALASIFAAQSPMVVLDEPTVNQDGYFRRALVRFLARLEEFGFTLIIVTHDLEFATAATDRWILLEAGEVIADGSPRAVSEKLGALPGQPTVNHIQWTSRKGHTLGKAQLG